MKHLVREMHDVVNQPVSIWCDAERWSHECTEHIEDVTCTDCLHAAVEYGGKAQDQLVKLQQERMAARARK